MKMQRSTAQSLVYEINAALQKSTDDTVILPEIVGTLIADIVARADLQKAIDNS